MSYYDVIEAQIEALKARRRELLAIDFMQANIAWLFASFIIICLFTLFN